MNTLYAEIRSPKAKAKSLRRSGVVPACIYGSDLPSSISIQITQRDAEKIFRENSPGTKVGIEVGGKKIVTLLKDISKDTITNNIQHVDFQALVANKKVNSISKVVLLNKDKISGFVSQILFDIPYMALPEHIVDTVVIDLMDLHIGSQVTVGDLDIAKNENVELLIDANNLVLSILENKSAPSVSEEEEE